MRGERLPQSPQALGSPGAGRPPARDGLAHQRDKWDVGGSFAMTYPGRFLLYASRQSGRVLANASLTRAKDTHFSDEKVRRPDSQESPIARGPRDLEADPYPYSHHWSRGAATVCPCGNPGNLSESPFRTKE